MITEQDLQAAIAECQGQRNPTANTCIKLAAFYTIKNELFGKPTVESHEPTYSYSSGSTKIDYDGTSEFAELVNGMEQYDVMKVVDELMETIHALNPRLYASVLRKLQ